MTIPILDHGFVRYIDHMGSDTRIVESARISYKSPSKGEDEDKKLLNYLWKNKHLSPFEMCKVSFNIKMPLFVMRQYVRHRVQNLNEVSARYTVLPSEFYIPETWRQQDKVNKQGSLDVGTWDPQLSEGTATELTRLYCETGYKLYEEMLEAGVAKEMARMVLPVNIYTEIYSTWDLRNLLHFFTLRDDNHAQLEIREVANAMKQIVTPLFPATMEAYEKHKWVLA